MLLKANILTGLFKKYIGNLMAGEIDADALGSGLELDEDGKIQASGESLPLGTEGQIITFNNTNEAIATSEVLIKMNPVGAGGDKTTLTITPAEVTHNGIEIDTPYIGLSIYDSFQDAVNIRYNDVQVTQISNDGQIYSQNYSGENLKGTGERLLTADSNGKIIEATNQAGNEIKNKKVTLLSSDILNIHTTSVDLIDAPGGNSMIEILSICMVYRYGTVAYTNGGDKSIVYDSSTSYPTIGLLLGAMVRKTSSVEILVPMVNTSFGTGVVLRNQKIFLLASAGQFLSGDGEVDIYLRYRIIEIE